MKLFEHPDFEQAIIRAAEHFRLQGLREAIVEKDYFVTEALRIIEQEAGGKVIFKGGTSLSKGWEAINSFARWSCVSYKGERNSTRSLVASTR